MAGQAGGQDESVVPRARARHPVRTADAFTGGTCPSVDITRSKAETGLLVSRLSTNVWLRAVENWRFARWRSAVCVSVSVAALTSRGSMRRFGRRYG